MGESSGDREGSGGRHDAGDHQKERVTMVRKCETNVWSKEGKQILHEVKNAVELAVSP